MLLVTKTRKILALAFVVVSTLNTTAKSSFGSNLKFTNNLNINVFDLTMKWNNRRETMVEGPTLVYEFHNSPLKPGGMLIINGVGDNLVDAGGGITSGKGFWTDKEGNKIQQDDNIIFFDLFTPVVDRCNLSSNNIQCFNFSGAEVSESYTSVPEPTQKIGTFTFTTFCIVMILKSKLKHKKLVKPGTSI